MFKKISLVIPVYNEEGNLIPLHEDIKKLYNTLELEVIFVDDGSMDNSMSVLKNIQKKDSRVKIISFTKNYGQTAAMGAGVKLSSGEIIVFLDADLQNDPTDIPKLLEKMNEGFDVVSGWRKKRKDEFFRVWLSRIANRLIAKVSKVSIHDYGCTLKAYRGELVRKIDFYGEVHRLIPMYASGYGAKIAEIRVNHRPRIHGESKYGFLRVFKVLMDLLVAKFLLGYSAKPIYFFGFLSFLCFALGFISFIFAIVLRLYGISLIQTPLLLLTVMLFVLGIQFVTFGLLADLILRSYYNKDRTTYSIKERIGF